MRFHHRPAAALLLAGALLLSGCDLPAIDEPRPAPTTSKSTGPRTTGKHRYSWVGSLPAGDPRPDPDGAVYAALADGDCDSVAADLADASGNFPFWSRLDSPQHVLLYRAAVYFCAGDTERGKRMFLRAGDTYGGWPGLKGRVYVCRIYRAAASVVYQRPQRDFPCRPGTPPPWGDPQVNPLDPTQRVASEEPADPATAPTTGS